MTERFQDFLIRVRGAEASGSYPVECEASDGSRAQGELRLDRQALLSAQLDAQAFGMALFEALFSGPVGRAYQRAIGRAGAEAGGRLRVRLWIEPKAAELHAVPWERLYHAPENQPIPLATSALNPFSRYTALDARDPQPVPTRPIRLLFALSNPKDLPEGLRPLEVDEEVRVLRDALGDLRRDDRVRVTLLPGRSQLSPDLLSDLEREGYDVLEGPTTFDLLTRLAGRHEIVHFVGHGAFRRDAASGQSQGHAALYLEREDGGWAPAPDQDLVDRVAPLEPPLPYLVFLSACESARQEGNAAHPFVGLGPKLVEAGVPAVVGMQAVVPTEVNRELSREFYRNLFEHGIVDLALNQARLTLYHRRDIDWAIPVLFSRLRWGRLFVPQSMANRVVTSEGVIQETEHGALVTKAKGPDAPERVPPPVRLLPRRPEVLGRTDEIAAAAARLAEGKPVEFYGPAGSGKTTLLRHLSFHPPESAPDGVVYLARRSLPVDDLLEALFEATYTSEGSYKPTGTQLLQLFQDLRVLVAVDDADLSREDVQRLVDSVPGSPFLLASAERNLWGEGWAFSLEGLTEDAGLALFERELGRTLIDDDRARAAALCRDLGGSPLRIIQAAARVRDDGLPVAALGAAAREAPAFEGMGAADLAALSADERTVLSALAALEGAAIDPEHLVGLTGVHEAPLIAERLRRAGLAKAASPQFAVAERPADQVLAELDTRRWQQHLLDYFTRWAEAHRGDPGRVLEDIDPILATLAWAWSEKQLEGFLRLARASEEALIVGRRWATWRSLLRQEVEAAQALGDEAARGRALHQLGTQALTQDARRSAKRYLKEALRIRKSTGDREGARLTRHNLKLLPVLLVPPFVMITFLVLVVGSLSVIGSVIAGGGTLGLKASPPTLDFGPRFTGTASRGVVEVRLTGDPVVIDDVALSPQSEDFSVTTDCSGRIEDAGCTAVILFTPETAGPHDADVIVSYNGPLAPLVIHLTGVGVPHR